MYRRAHRPARRGYTLLEMVVVMAVLAVVASTAGLLYRDHVVDAQDKGASTTVNQVADDAQQLLAAGPGEVDARGQFTYDTLKQSVAGLDAQLLAYAPGLYASVELANGFTLTNGPSTGFGVISTDVQPGSAADSATVAMLSRSGNCASVNFTVEGLPTTTVAAVSAGGSCSAGQGTAATGAEAPQALTCTPQDASVLLGWTVADGQAPASFDVYLDGSLQQSEPASATSSVVTGLTNGRTYSLTVVMYDQQGHRSASSDARECAPTDTAAPTAPQLSVTAGVRRATLNWLASTDASLAGYRVYRASSTEPRALVASPGSDELTWTDTGTAPAGLVPRQYTYDVVAYDTTNNETRSNEVTVTPLDDGPPPTPTLTGTGGVGQVALAWAPVTAPYGDLGGYRLYRCVGAGCSLPASPTLYQQFSAAAVSGTDTSGITAGTTYRYWLSAFDTEGNESATSDPVTVTTTGVPSPPTVAATVSGSSVTWTWDAPAGTTAFETTGQNPVTGTTSGSADAGDLPATTTTWTGTSLASGSQFTLSVRACSAAGCSAWGTASAWTVPAAPTSLATTTGQVRQVPLTWSAPSGTVTSYRVYMGTTSSSAAATLVRTVNSPAGNQSLTVSALADGTTALANGTTYWFWVSAVNAGGEGPRSLSASAATMSLPSNLSYGSSQCVFSYSSSPSAFGMQYPQQCRVTLTATGATSYTATTATGPEGYTQSVANNGFTSSLPYMGGVDSLASRMLLSGGRACNAAGCTTAASEYWSPTPRPSAASLTKLACGGGWCFYQFSATKAMNYHVQFLNPYSSATVSCSVLCSGGDFSDRTGNGNIGNGLSGVFISQNCFASGTRTGCARTIAVTQGVAIRVSGASIGVVPNYAYGSWCWPPGFNVAPVEASCAYSGWRAD